MNQSGFNLLKELYLNNDNRNILEDTLLYLDRFYRGRIIRSFTLEYGFICLNCFERYDTYYGQNRGDCCNFFCFHCAEYHFSRYTEIKQWEFHDCGGFYVSCDIIVSHSCYEITDVYSICYGNEELIQRINGEDYHKMNVHHDVKYYDDFYNGFCRDVVLRYGKGTRCYDLLTSWRVQ